MKKVFNKTIKAMISLSMIFMLMFGTVAPGLTNWTGQHFGVTESFALDAATTFTFTNTTGANMLDGNKATSSPYTGDIKWDGNLIGEAIEITLSSAVLFVRNASGQNLKFIDLGTKQISNSSYFDAGSGVTKRIIVPEGTTHININGEASRVYEISVDGRNKPSALENVAIVPNDNSIEFNFTKDSNVHEVVAYVDGVLHGAHSGTNIKLNALLSKQTYAIELIPLTIEGVPGPIQKFNVSTLDNGLNFRFPSKLNTTAFNMLDEDKATYTRYSGKVTWDGDLTGEVMEMNASGAQLLFKNASNQNLKFIDADTHQILSGVILSAANVTKRFIVPEGTAYVDLNGEASILYDISLDVRAKPSNLDNVTLTPSYNSIEVDYEKPANVYEVAIYVDGVYHGRHTGSNIKLTALLSRQAYNIELIPFTSNSVPGPIQKFNVSTLDNGLNFRFPSKLNTTAFNMLDEDKATYTRYSGKVTWDGDLTGEVMEVNASGMQLLFKNASNQNLKFIDADTYQLMSGVILSDANITKRFIVPEGTVYVDLSGEASILYDISIDGRDKPLALDSVTLTPSYNSIEVGYEKSTNVYDVAVYVDGVYHGRHTGNTIKLTALLSKQSYSIDLIPFTSEGVPGLIQKFVTSTTDSGHNFRFPSKTNTTGFNMLDDSKSTYIPYSGNITWTGNLASQIIEVTASGSQFLFKNVNNQNVNFIDADTKQVLSSVILSAANVTRRFIVPEGAAYINVSGESSLLYDILSDSRMNENAQAILNATAAVVKAEVSKLQSDVNAAATLVDALILGIEKTTLSARIDAVQAFIDAETAKANAVIEAMAAVAKAEESNSQEDIDHAKALVNALEASPKKTELLAKTNEVQAQIDAIKLESEKQVAVTVANASVAVAETERTLASIAAARIVVEALHDCLEKIELTNRLDAIMFGPINVSQEYKVADTKINLAMSLPREPYLSLALLAIEKVADPVEKAALAAEMENAIEKATQTTPVTTKTANLFVRLAEITGRDKYIALAETKTSQIVDEAEKQDAITRMDIAKLVKSPAEKRAYSALIAAEQWKSGNMITAAAKLINALVDGPLKTSLIERINNIIE